MQKIQLWREVGDPWLLYLWSRPMKNHRARESMWSQSPFKLGTAVATSWWRWILNQVITSRLTSRKKKQTFIISIRGRGSCPHDHFITYAIKSFNRYEYNNEMELGAMSLICEKVRTLCKECSLSTIPQKIQPSELSTQLVSSYLNGLD